MSKFFCYVALIQTLFASLAMASDGFGQRLEQSRISSDWKNTSLEGAFSDIQAQTDLFFTYTYETIKDIKISCRNENLAVSDILKYISGETGLRFKIAEDIIYVYKGNYDAGKKVRINVPEVESLSRLLDDLDYPVIYELSPFSFDADEVIKGSVTGPDGEPLVGATIIVKENGQGTVTDVDGTFSLALPDEGDYTLVVSYVGYETIEVALGSKANLNIVLQESLTSLDEIIVIGYGTGTKEKFNGAVSKIENERINNYAAASLDQAIAGTLAGVQISGNNKNPGENSVIQIRGISTLTAGTNPLIVVDGNPLTEGSALSTINTQDIESISVLKDAASAAIYGSRASNGVILITTKKGQEGRLRVTYDGYLGYQERIDKFELADAYETANFDYDARNFGYLSGGEGRSITDDNATRDANGGGKRSRIQPFLQDYLDGKPGLTNTDWADAVFRNAPQQNHYLNLSGGNGKTDYSISFGYFSQDNIVIDADYERYTNNFKLNSELNDYIRFGITSNIAISNANPVGYRAWSDFNLSAGPDPAHAIVLMHPYYPIYDEEGVIAPALQLEDNNANWDGPISGNAVATIELTDYTQHAFRFFGNTYLEVEPLAGLKFKTSFGGDFNTGTEEFFAPSTLGNYRTPVADSRAMAFKEDMERENFNQ